MRATEGSILRRAPLDDLPVIEGGQEWPKTSHPLSVKLNLVVKKLTDSAQFVAASADWLTNKIFELLRFALHRGPTSLSEIRRFLSLEILGAGLTVQLLKQASHW